MGSGAAINITLYKRITQENNKYIEAFDCHKLFYSLGLNEEIEGGVFTRQSNILAALYKDIFGDEHLSLMFGDTLMYGKIKEIDNLPEEIQKELKEKYRWIKCNPNP